MAKREHVSLKTKLAAALLEVDRYQNGSLCIPFEHSKAMSVDQICSLWVFDHWPLRKADGGTDHPSNLTPRLIAAHREKTAKVDVPEMAKSKRIRREEEEHRAIMAGALPVVQRWKRQIASRPWAMEAVKWERPKRRIPSRPFQNKKRKFANRNGNKI